MIFDDPQVFDVSMDFDNPKVYGDTSALPKLFVHFSQMYRLGQNPKEQLLFRETFPKQDHQSWRYHRRLLGSGVRYPGFLIE